MQAEPTLRSTIEQTLLNVPDANVSTATLCLWLGWHLATPQATDRPDMADRRRLLTWSQACGTYLGRLAKNQGDRVEPDRTPTRRSWIIKREGK